MTPGRQGSESKALTMQSECMPWRTLARVQFSPSSGLIMTPWPMVPTRMVPFFAMVHPLRSCGRSRLLRWRLYARRRAAATRSTHSHARRGSYAGLAPLSRVPRLLEGDHRLPAGRRSLPHGPVNAQERTSHLSCHRFRANEVRLLLGVTVDNLRNRYVGLSC